MSTFYPLAVGNNWTYRMQDGRTFTNTVIDVEDDNYTMINTMIPRPQHVRKDGQEFLADNFEPNNYQVFLRDDLKKGDTWDITYRGNNINTVLQMTVKETGMTKEVEGQTYEDVIMIEGDMKMNAEGNLVATNYLVQYYYASGVGLILNTTSYGDSMGLVSHELK